jgi:hypothetical protein
MRIDSIVREITVHPLAAQMLNGNFLENYFTNFD